MTPGELRAAVSLAAIFGLRLFGMFVILPVFAVWASARPGWTLSLVGIAMGAYGFTQGILQIPFGWLSDRHGRKRLLYVGLALFSGRRFACALADSPWTRRRARAAGRGRGVGVAALRTSRANRSVPGAWRHRPTFGLAFAVSFVSAPYLEHRIGVPGIFAMTGVLAIAAMAVVRWIVPEAPLAAHAPDSGAIWKALREPELVRLNVGIFTLHAVLMAMFIVVPFALVRGGLPSSEHWWVYLCSVGAGIVFVLPVLIGRAAAHERRVFLASVATIGISLAVLALGLDRLEGVIAALVIFFAGFNVLEAKLPALVSRAAPREATGAATGVYSSVQFLGTFFGAAAGGALAQHAGFAAVPVACLVAVAAWLAVAWNMGDFVPAASPASRT
jgi:predicted MFS family arabinose efflux permease